MARPKKGLGKNFSIRLAPDLLKRLDADAKARGPGVSRVDVIRERLEASDDAEAADSQSHRDLSLLLQRALDAVCGVSHFHGTPKIDWRKDPFMFRAAILFLLPGQPKFLAQMAMWSHR